MSIPEYARLKEMQGKALKLDRMMKQLMQKMGPEKLKARHSQSWDTDPLVKVGRSKMAIPYNRPKAICGKFIV